MTRVLAPSARPFITYEIPPERRQVTRAPGARDAFRDVVAFAERCTKWLGRDRPQLTLSVCGMGDVEDAERAQRIKTARRRATERFGTSFFMPGETLRTPQGPLAIPERWQWFEPLTRAALVLGWLEDDKRQLPPGWLD